MRIFRVFSRHVAMYVHISGAAGTDLRIMYDTCAKILPNYVEIYCNPHLQ